MIVKPESVLSRSNDLGFTYTFYSSDSRELYNFSFGRPIGRPKISVIRWCIVYAQLAERESQTESIGSKVHKGRTRSSAG